MSKMSVRIKCPCCGMQVSQGRLNQDYWPLEISYFEVGNRGKGKRGGFSWSKNVTITGKELILIGLRNKLRRLLERVEIALYGYSTTAPFVLESRASLSARLPRASWKSQLGRTNVEMRVKPWLKP